MSNCCNKYINLVYNEAEQIYPKFSVYSYQPDVKQFVTGYTRIH